MGWAAGDRGAHSLPPQFSPQMSLRNGFPVLSPVPCISDSSCTILGPQQRLGMQLPALQHLGHGPWDSYPEGVSTGLCIHLHGATSQPTGLSRGKRGCLPPVMDKAPLLLVRSVCYLCSVPLHGLPYPAHLKPLACPSPFPLP